MKRKIGELYGKSIVEGDNNIITSNEININSLDVGGNLNSLPKEVTFTEKDIWVWEELGNVGRAVNVVIDTPYIIYARRKDNMFREYYMPIEVLSIIPGTLLPDTKFNIQINNTEAVRKGPDGCELAVPVTFTKGSMRDLTEDGIVEAGSGKDSIIISKSILEESHILEGSQISNLKRPKVPVEIKTYPILITPTE